MTPRQMAFDLGVEVTYARADFFASPANAAGWQAVMGWHDWPRGLMLLTGPEGAGKTHLAHIWADIAGAVILPAAALPGLDPTTLPPAVVVDDADEAAGLPAPEEALFHLHNHIRNVGGHMLLTARTPPRDWGLGLPDLISRMQATPIAQLDAPDDALLSAVLVKLFTDRQVAVPANLIPYLISRMPRSIGVARALVAELDARALALGRPITRALASEILGAD